MVNRSGQVLVLVLLVVVVALSIGLSVASRNITNLKTSTQTEQSQRVFSAAEGGVEDVLSRLNTFVQDHPEVTTAQGASEGIPIGTSNITANVNVRALTAYEQVVDEGSVGQINLDGAYVSGVRTIVLEWGKKNSEEVSGIVASMQVNFICQQITCFSQAGIPGQSFSQFRQAYTVNASPGNETGFTPCPDISSADFACKVTFSLPNDNVKFLRIRPFWNKATIKVANPPAEPRLPIQEYNVTSTASTEQGITRRVQVSRAALPQLPAIFDYVFFAEDAASGIVK
jgi:hypothetical protein